MRRAVAFALLIAIPGIALGQTCPAGTVPPVDRQANEISAVKNDFLQGRCAPLVFERFSFPGMQPRKVSFSRSAEFGDVVRVDVGRPSDEKYWRFVCFKKQDVSKVLMAIYDLKTGSCYAPESHAGYWTIYPPLKY
jgi:hypothetical protein